MFTKQAPGFVVISWTQNGPRLIQQGEMSPEAFRRLFLDRYEFTGERYHPGQEAAVGGALIASDESIVVTVPIWIWNAADGTVRLLCQASDDGSPPAFSVLAFSESDLLNHVSEEMRRTNE